LPVPLTLSNGFRRIKTALGDAILYFRNGYVCIHGKVGATIVKAKVRVLEGCAAAQSVVIESYRHVASAAAMYASKTRGTLSSIRGRVGDAIVSVRIAVSARAASLTVQAQEVYRRMLNGIKKLPVAQWITNQVTILRNKVTDVFVYVHRGCLHAVTALGDKLFYVKAKVFDVCGAAKLRILATYIGAKASVLRILDRGIASLLATYGLAKQWALDTMEPVITKTVAVVDRSKAAAAARPIAVSAGSGGLAGLTVGSLTGVACSLPFALFTFGLSIPVGATIGGTAGVTVGAVGGSAIGYGYEHRAQIKAGVDGAVSRVVAVKETAVSSAGNLVSRASWVRSASA
jgi:hypothetical protein